MATTATAVAAVDDTVYATMLEHDIQRELRPHRIFRNFMRQGAQGPSKAFTFTTLDDLGTSTITQSITEGSTDLISANWATINTTGVLVTAAQIGILSLVTDLAKTVSILDVGGEVADDLARSMAEKYDIDMQTAIKALTNATGGATTGSIARMLTVISALEQRDVGSRGEQLVAGIHPKQLGDIRADVVGLTATFLAGDNANVNGVLAKSLDGYVGDPFGVPVWHSTTISNTGGYYEGWILSANSAVGAYELWLERTELQRDASKVSTEVVCTSCYAAAIIDNNRLQGWRSST